MDPRIREVILLLGFIGVVVVWIQRRVRWGVEATGTSYIYSSARDHMSITCSCMVLFVLLCLLLFTCLESLLGLLIGRIGSGKG